MIFFKRIQHIDIEECKKQLVTIDKIWFDGMIRPPKKRLCVKSLKQIKHAMQTNGLDKRPGNEMTGVLVWCIYKLGELLWKHCLIFDGDSTTRNSSMVSFFFFFLNYYY